MNIIKKIILFLKNIFIMQNKTKALEESKQIEELDRRNEFINTVKIKVKEKKQIIETLVCDGDGLGIQKSIKF